MTGWDPNYFDKDEETLHELGYKQQLERSLFPAQNFGISFSVMAVGVTVTSYFALCFSTGGPATMTISWIIVSFFSFLLALSVAEIVSALPTSGGPYSWAATLAPRHYSGFASWLTAWFNIAGLSCSSTSLAYAFAQFTSTALEVKTNWIPSEGETIAICAAVLCSWFAMNTIGRPYLRHLIYVAIVVNSVGIISLAVAVLIKAPTHQPPSFVFAKFVDNSGSAASESWSTRISPAYVALIGSPMGLTAFFGYEASAHVAEETIRASWVAPLCIIVAVASSGIVGLFVLVAFLFSIQDLSIFNHESPVLALIIDIFGENGGLALFSIPIISCWFCGLFMTLSNSRLIWAFSRDHGLPNCFSIVNERFVSPIWAVGLTTLVSFILCLSSLGSEVAFVATTSTAVLAVLLSYGIPILFMIIYNKEFCLRKGPFQLGLASRPIGILAVCWVAFACVVASLPTSTPVTKKSLNYAPIALCFVITWSVVLWVLGARKIYLGPVRNWNPTDFSNLMGETTISNSPPASKSEI